MHDSSNGLRKQAATVLCAVVAATGYGEARAADDLAVLVDQQVAVLSVLDNDDTLGEQRRLVRVTRPQFGSTMKIGPNQVRYQAPAGFVGSDTFTYSAVGSGRTSLTATVTVRVGSTLSIEGRVTDAPIPDAQVTYTVGDQTYATQADADGNYSIAVVDFGEPDMVVASAVGGPDQPLVSFQSILGEVGRLADEAGADGVLDRTENNQVQVTNLSTAQSVLVQLANGGGFPADDNQYGMAFEALNVGQVLTMAAAIKLVVDGGYALPEGTANTLELVANAASLSAFVAGVDPEVMTSTVASILSDPEVLPPVEPGNVPESIAFVVPGRVGTIRKGVGTGQLLALADDGTGTYLNQNGGVNPGITWTENADGSIEVVYDEPRTVLSFPSKNGVQIRAFYTTERFSLRKIGASGGVDLIAMSSESVVTYPDNPEYPDEVESGTSTQLGYLEGVGELPYAFDEIVGARGLPFPAAGLLYDPKDFGYAVQQFNADGSGSIPTLGRSFQWTLGADGRLNVDHGTDGVVTVRRIQLDGRLGEGIIASAELGSGARISQFEMSVPVDPGFIAVAEDFHGVWRSGFMVSNPSIPVESLEGFYAYWQPDGSGYTFSIDPANVLFGTLYYDWTLNGEQLAGWGDYCDTNGCFEVVGRRWRIMAVDGDRVYVVEELSGERNGNMEFVDQRSNFYDLTTPPELPQRGTPAPEVKPAPIGVRRATR